MSRKHFIALADRIISANARLPGTFPERAIEILASFCASQNSNFNNARWWAYIEAGAKAQTVASEGSPRPLNA